jgi:hypothetical protein
MSNAQVISNVALNSNQQAVANQIAQYGLDHGYSESEIEIAVKTAFIESSLGEQLTGTSKTESGLYQYTDDTWNEQHSDLGAKNNFDNQIEAFYQDMSRYETRYNDLSDSDKSEVSLEEYIYIKHHDGSSATDFSDTPGKGKSIWDNSNFECTDPSVTPDDLNNGQPLSSSDPSLPDKLAELSIPIASTIAASDDPTAIVLWVTDPQPQRQFKPKVLLSTWYNKWGQVKR